MFNKIIIYNLLTIYYKQWNYGKLFKCVNNTQKYQCIQKSYFIAHEYIIFILII